MGSDEDKTVDYTYDSNGLIIKKVLCYCYSDDRDPDEYTTNYYYDGDKLITQIKNNIRLDFLYDENGMLYGLIKDNSSKYFYVRDYLQNILGIVDQSGKLVVKYKYDAYGNSKGIEDTSGCSLGSRNPFRYKGYYYDDDTEMYYCKSRFYVPKWRRWLNSDSINYLEPQNITCLNLFAYCNNNPVMYVDENGNFAFFILTAVIGAIIGGLAAGITSYQHGARGWEVVGWSALGSVCGGALGAGVGAIASKLLTGLFASSITTVYNGVKSLAWAYTLGGTSGAIGFLKNNIKYNRGYFPVNDGFATISQVTLQPGQYLQRIGGEGGFYASPYYTDPFSLSLPYDKLNQMNNISIYEVMNPITVNAGPAVPYFGQYGGGMQYRFGETIAKLIAEGILRRI